MKIIYYFRDYGTPMFAWQTEHIVGELSHHDCTVDMFNPLEYDSFDEANERLLEKIKANKYDLFMTCHNEQILYIDTLEKIKALGIPTLLFCPDNLVAPFNHEKVANKFDLVWLTSKDTQYLFDKWGCKSIFLPYAANPFFLKPHFETEEDCRIGFIGTPHGSRIDYINLFTENDVPIAVHTAKSNFDSSLISASASSYYHTFLKSIRFPIGRKLMIATVKDKLGYRKLKNNENLEILPPIPLSDLAVYNGKYALTLSFTDANSTGVLKKPVKIVNLRNFEVPMSGGLQITMYSDELAEYFQDGKEIVLGKTKAELVDKAKYYLDPQKHELRMTMKRNARLRAESDHTWWRRFQKVFEEMNITERRK